ncbi:MAG: cysteine--tRNA ligase [Chloroflexi bacterium]|nr:cysteine--tRNA ligase [Chloroflexota bacterium]
MRLYNTLTRTRDEFKPLGDEVLMYVCGVTTNDRPHLGHALSSIVFDVLHRYLEFKGLKVKRVQNFTDVDDKIINRAKQDNVTPEDLSERNIAAFFEDMDSLNVRRATVHPRATEEIPEIIAMIETLIERGAAYEADDSVYFRVRVDDDYGKLSRRSLEDMLEGTRFENEDHKEDPADFALWKASKPGEPAWDSPWGQGRPGWHIECSAMANHHLGRQIDIHGGGLDLIFPHHENELAQTETALGVNPFSQFWAHNGLLKLAGDEKMSKSLGNVVTVQDARAKYSSDAIRLWVLQSHYRSPTVLTDTSFDQAETALRSIRIASNVSPRTDGEKVDASALRLRFVEAMDDDLNTPRAVATLFEVCHAINREDGAGHDTTPLKNLLNDITGVFGLTLEDPKREEQAGGISADEIERLIADRKTARAERRWADADAIRDQLQEAGIAIADGPTGTTWSRV